MSMFISVNRDMSADTDKMSTFKINAVPNSHVNIYTEMQWE